MWMDEAEIEEALAKAMRRIGAVRGPLLPLLHALQHETGWIPETAVASIAQRLNLSRAEVHGVVSFYHDFRTRPPARHIIKLCRAEACRARGGVAIEAQFVDRLGTGMNRARDDGQVALEAIYCLGLCATGPNALVDGRPVSRIDAARAERIAAEVSA
jgi:formate dehydrogenase subunit gamma